MSHPVISVFSNEGTDYLREIITAAGGLAPAARLLGEDKETVAKWSRSGLPKRLWVAARYILENLHGVESSLSQRQGYDMDTAFSRGQ